MVQEFNQQAYIKMAQECSQRELCSFMVREKLLKRLKCTSSTPEIEQIIAKLSEEKYIDDSRFLSAYISDKIKFNFWGPKKIESALVAIGFDKRQIENKLEDYSDLIEDSRNALIERKSSELLKKRASQIERNGKKYRVKIEKNKAELERLLSALKRLNTHDKDYSFLQRKCNYIRKKISLYEYEAKNLERKISASEKSKLIAFLKSRGFE